MPKILGHTLTDHREMTRARLFTALRELMAEQPFNMITMSMIANRAEVGRTAVYNHFADKEVLLLAFMEQTTADFSELLTQAIKDHDDPITQLIAYVRAHIEMTDKYHLAAGLNLRQHVSRETSHRLHHHADLIASILRHILLEAMKTDRIPHQNPDFLVALIHSALAGHHLPSSPARRESSIQQIQLFILRGVGAAPSDLPEIPAPHQGPQHMRTSPDNTRSQAAFLRCPVH
ncbi:MULTISPECIES: TetR/AcrR family transcriptional regulator [unclassified Schaalia]|uniref:TetR/AcrR family transcriptional regulator n=1 Tax=unclassified Schaalia TaxID=2691889 RepID=UPI001E56B239|nr:MULTISPECIES: TetR/AcrR family transcriptional regulator [unclassified Schaalia]MCD4548974.1 TetR/AcrR family transcriptional regulator [Schaalia sp. lx-260]MCD4557585.1 TetR/AcrR family transcriptional regulator [Schaalia sp. lx-100]